MAGKKPKKNSKKPCIKGKRMKGGGCYENDMYSKLDISNVPSYSRNQWSLLDETILGEKVMNGGKSKNRTIVKSPKQSKSNFSKMYRKFEMLHDLLS